MFHDLSINTIKNMYISKEINPVELAQECLSRYERLEPTYKAWVCFDKEVLFNAAELSKVRIESGGMVRPLEGIPIGVKDIFNSEEFPTQMGSPLWKGFTPGNDARVVYYLKNAGGIVPGKTVTAEFAVHTLNDTVNPHNSALTPGTSSSGSAVAVALGMVPAAIGTQTAGSIVRPASFCGVYGYKPSFGLIPRTGILKTTDSLDSIGYFVSRPDDLKTVFDVLRVHGPNFPISNRALNDMSRQEKPPGRPWKVAFVKTHTWAYAYDYAKQALTDYAAKVGIAGGFEINEVEIPEEMNQSHFIHETIYNKTLSYYFNEEYQKAELVSPIMNSLIESGIRISVEEYHRALKVQEQLIRLMDDFFADYDAIISLSTAGEAPLRDDVERVDPALMWTLAHLPVVSVPLFTSPSNNPYGIQIVARKYNDFLLLNIIEYLLAIGLIPKTVNPRIY
jgi:Asp-tRNA(Asn)/Glu-tRNA(Gln) amidotransferase A subunit family amidase